MGPSQKDQNMHVLVLYYLHRLYLRGPLLGESNSESIGQAHLYQLLKSSNLRVSPLSRLVAMKFLIWLGVRLWNSGSKHKMKTHIASSFSVIEYMSNKILTNSWWVSLGSKPTPTSVFGDVTLKHPNFTTSRFPRDRLSNLKVCWLNLRYCEL